MSDFHSNPLLAACISAINTLRFTPSLVRLIQSLCDFDCAVILGYSAGKHPVYLYDSIETGRQLLFQRYLTSAFQQDPFYKQVISEQQGIFSLKEVLQKYENQAYMQQFYMHTGWQDELCMAINISPGRAVLIFLGATIAEKRFKPQQIALLEPSFPIIKALCQQHWRHAAFNLSQPIDEVIVNQKNLRLYLDMALQTFAEALLTKRERQIACLLVQGFASTEIAEQLGVTLGTVKNHRKKIYAQLNINSLGELFQLFLNHLLTQSLD